jgi:hypothetical protein
MILGNHPGPWQSYVKRTDNIGLHILEVRNKYLQEQLQYDNQLSQMYSMQNFQSKGSHTNVVEDSILLEDGGSLLQEDGGSILL